jgi:hypothetical protein
LVGDSCDALDDHFAPVDQLLNHHHLGRVGTLRILKPEPGSIHTTAGLIHTIAGLIHTTSRLSISFLITITWDVLVPSAS